MAKKRKNNDLSNSTEEIVKKVKSLFVEVVVRDWLNTPIKEWRNLTPLDMIRKGEGQKILEALKTVDTETKIERTPKKENKDVRGSGKVEKSTEQDPILFGE